MTAGDLAQRTKVSPQSLSDWQSKTLPDDAAFERFLVNALALRTRQKPSNAELHSQLRERLAQAKEAREAHRSGPNEVSPSRPEPRDTLWRDLVHSCYARSWALSDFSLRTAGVHEAIDLDADSRTKEPPRYVRRAHDAELQNALMDPKPQAVFLRGTSSCGKTRSLFQAIKSLPESFSVVQPSNAASLRQLMASPFLDRPTVLWLDELQKFCGPDGTGLSEEGLVGMFSLGVPLVIAGTIWPDKAMQLLNLRADGHVEAPRLLSAGNPLVHWLEIPRTLTTLDELAEAKRAGLADARLRRAVDDKDLVGFGQSLAGAAELLDHFNNSPTHATRLLSLAAAQIRRLGVQGAISEDLLGGVTRALWRQERGLATLRAETIVNAFDYLTEPIRHVDGIQLLRQVGAHEGNESTMVTATAPRFFELADYIEQHLMQVIEESPVPDSVWTVMIDDEYLSSGDFERLASAARARVRTTIEEKLLARAVEKGGTAAAALGLADIMMRTNRQSAAGEILVGLADNGHPDGLNKYLSWLEQSGRSQDLEAFLSKKIREGNKWAIPRYVTWLQRVGREDDVGEVLRISAEASDVWSQVKYVEWLLGKGRRSAAADIVRDMTVPGNLGAVRKRADWLQRIGFTDKARQTILSVASTEPAALRMKASWLYENSDAETEQALRSAMVAGVEDAQYMLFRLLLAQGRFSDEIVAAGLSGDNDLADERVVRDVARFAEIRGWPHEVGPLLSKLAESGSVCGLEAFISWLMVNGGSTQAYEAFLAFLAAYPEDDEVFDLFLVWVAENGTLEQLDEYLFGPTGEAYELELLNLDDVTDALMKRDVHSVDARAALIDKLTPFLDDSCLRRYTLWLRRNGRSVQAGDVLELLAERGSVYDAEQYALWHDAEGRASETEALLRNLASRSDWDAPEPLIRWLLGKRRATEALEFARLVATQRASGLDWLLKYFGSYVDDDEVDALYRLHVDRNILSDAVPAYARWLRSKGRNESIENLLSRLADFDEPSDAWRLDHVRKSAGLVSEVSEEDLRLEISLGRSGAKDALLRLLEAEARQGEIGEILSSGLDWLGRRL